MRVYVESNFVLEIVFEQEQHLACEALVDLAEKQEIELALPAYALLEPHDTLVRRNKEREALRRDLQTQGEQLKRTASLADEVNQLERASAVLSRANQDSFVRFREASKRLLETANLLAIDVPVLREGATMAEGLSLELPDALMLASVTLDAKRRPSIGLFLNRNAKDFDQPEIKTQLKALGIDLLPDFVGGLARVRSELSHPART